jgi:murein DD-endopeptidase MepM/ murein hydrolase activator NlpD
MTGLRPFFFVAVGVLLAGCGWMEWPPPSAQPRAAAQPPPSRPAASVVAASGDTVYDIARRHRVSVRAVIEANGLRPPYRLRAGQRLVLPRPPSHLVIRGDTLYGISRRYRVGMYALARANGLGPPYTILVGQRLRLPGGSAPPSPKARPKPAAAPKAAGAAPPKTSARLPAPVAKPPPPAVPAPPPSSGKGFIWPVRGKVVSGFGPKAKGLHNDGVNIAAPRGTPVRAAENGVIAYAGNELRGYGNLLLVKHDNGWITAYAHTQELTVKRGQRVKKGQVIARVGSTGNVTTPQLHFELRRGKNAVDPVKYLKT